MVPISGSVSSVASDVVGVVVGMSAGTGDGVDGVLDGVGHGGYNTTEIKGIAVSRMSGTGCRLRWTHGFSPVVA
jgi:hypothetical protein